MSVDIKMYLKCSFIFKLVCLQSSLCIRTQRCKVSCVHLRMSFSMRKFARHWTMCHLSLVLALARTICNHTIM